MKNTYRVDEAAKELEVSRRTVERLIQSGDLKSFKVGDTRRIDVQELERLKKNEQRELRRT